MKPLLLDAQVTHRRPGRQANGFRYGVWYLGLPLSALDTLAGNWRFRVNAPALTSFWSSDHGPRDGGDLRSWLDTLLAEEGLPADIDDVLLVTMPRVFGYGFNPVSFWFCLDASGALRAVLCEVNNTYGETHHYLCRHSDFRPIEPGDRMCADKCFHVSPYFDRDGCYEFSFALGADELRVGIRYTDLEGELLLATALQGQLIPFSMQALRRLFWRHKLVPLKVIGLIHWQALKLVLKGLKFRSKPEQLHTRVSWSESISKTKIGSRRGVPGAGCVRTTRLNKQWKWSNW